MPRRRDVPKRKVLPDPKFGDVILSKFMNVLMYAGRKSIAEGIVYGAMDRIQQRGGHALALEDLVPLTEGEVAGDQQAATLVTLGEDLKEQLGSGAAEHQIASAEI